MRRNWYKKGSFNRIDDRSGFKKKAEQTREEWTGMIVAKESWEPRNAQDFVRGIPDLMWVEKPRPEAADTFIVPAHSGVALCQDPSSLGFNPILQENGDLILTDGLQ